MGISAVRQCEAWLAAKYHEDTKTNRAPDIPGSDEAEKPSLPGMDSQLPIHGKNRLGNVELPSQPAVKRRGRDGSMDLARQV